MTASLNSRTGKVKQTAGKWREIILLVWEREITDK
jgi:hypothetical protein